MASLAMAVYTDNSKMASMVETGHAESSGTASLVVTGWTKGLEMASMAVTGQTVSSKVGATTSRGAGADATASGGAGEQYVAQTHQNASPKMGSVTARDMTSGAVELESAEFTRMPATRTYISGWSATLDTSLDCLGNASITSSTIFVNSLKTLDWWPSCEETLKWHM